VLLNDNDTPMEVVVVVLERFFGMSNPEAITHMLRIHDEGRQSAAPTRAKKLRRK
jgi:ATP-dependent Clp protease adaptor protein ClpS